MIQTYGKRVNLMQRGFRVNKSNDNEIESSLINKNTITTNSIIQEQNYLKMIMSRFMEFGIQILIILNCLCGVTQMGKV